MGILDSLSFAPGGDPFATRLTLGDFEFVSFEVPEAITVGAKQQTKVHKLVGGKRVIDVLGTDYDTLSWSGWITGGTAGDRTKALETMRDAGQALVFVLDDYRFKVVIGDFKSRFEHLYRRPYTIELIVVERLDLVATGNALAGALDALINSDVGEAMGLSDIVNVQSVTDAVTAVQSAVSQVQDFANATVETVQTVVRPIVAAQQIIQSTISQVGAAINDITTLGGLIPGNPVSNAANNVLRQLNATTQLAPLYQMQAVLARLQKNVLSGPLANGTTSVVTGNTSLQKLAADNYGDQSKWTTIADANGMTDPVVTGIQTVKIPQGG